MPHNSEEPFIQELQRVTAPLAGPKPEVMLDLRELSLSALQQLEKVLEEELILFNYKGYVIDKQTARAYSHIRNWLEHREKLQCK